MCFLDKDIKNNINILSYDVVKTNVEASVLEVIEYFRSKKLPIHLSIDLDSLNPISTPGVSVPSKGGFSQDELITIIDEVIKNLRVVSVDIVEYNPLRDEDHRTLIFLKKLIDFLLKQRTNDFY
jgi:arginase